MNVLSLCDGMSCGRIALERVERNEEKAKCPECGAELSFTGGCNVCSSCGWSKCS